MFLIWNLPPRCTAQCQGQWLRKTWLWRTGRLWSTRTLKMKGGFSSGCWGIETRWYGRHRLWTRLWLSWFIPRLDLSAAGEVSELMNTGAYETYLKEECEDHWVKHIHLRHMRHISHWLKYIFTKSTFPSFKAQSMTKTKQEPHFHFRKKDQSSERSSWMLSLWTCVSNAFCSLVFNAFFELSGRLLKQFPTWKVNLNPI